MTSGLTAVIAAEDIGREHATRGLAPTPFDREPVGVGTQQPRPIEILQEHVEVAVANCVSRWLQPDLSPVRAMAQQQTESLNS